MTPNENDLLQYDESVDDEPYFSTDLYLGKYPFYKKKESNKVWWVHTYDQRGPLYISFDKLTVFNLWSDYPEKLTREQKEIFDEENPFWADFFSYRNIDYSKIHDFDDIPYHGDPHYVGRLPKGFRGNEKKYFSYLKKHNIDASNLSLEEAEEILRIINQENNDN